MATKTVLITGCSEGGIGDALAREFKLRGLRVFATGRSLEKMVHFRELGIRTLVLDVTSLESIKTAARRVERATKGRLDILINNSGCGYAMPFTDTSLPALHTLFTTNVYPILTVSQAFLPLLLRTHGVIANIGSTAAAMPPAYHTAYSASKAAVRAMGDTMRIELAPLGIHVVTVVTGAVKTNFLHNYVEGGKGGGGGLPEGSFYAGSGNEQVEAAFAQREFLELPIKAMAREEYARKVVGDLLKRNPPAVVWRGGFATAAWLIGIFTRVGAFRLAAAAETTECVVTIHDDGEWARKCGLKEWLCEDDRLLQLLWGEGVYHVERQMLMMFRLAQDNQLRKLCKLDTVKPPQLPEPPVDEDEGESVDWNNRDRAPSV